MTKSNAPRTEISFPADDQILVKADFAVPRDLVFRAFTEPALVTQWWGRPAGELVVCEIDLRPGGDWRYVFQPDGGEPASFHGTYLEVVPGERLRYVDVLDSLGGIEVRNTVTFSEANGRSTIEILAQHSSVANRDAQAATLGLPDDLPEPFDVLEQVVMAAE